MELDKIWEKIQSNKQEYNVLLWLLFNRDRLSFSPIYKPHFLIYDYEYAKDHIPIKDRYKDAPFYYALKDGGDLNLLSSFGNNNMAFVDHKEEFEKGRRFFNHPEFLYGYVVKMGNRLKYEVIYDRSKDNGITRIIAAALFEYMDYLGISSYEDLSIKLQEARQDFLSYSQYVFDHIPDKVYFDPCCSENNELEYVFSNRILSEMLAEYNTNEIRKTKTIIGYRLNENIDDIYSERNRFKPINCSSNKSMFVGNDYIVSWINNVEFAPIPTIHTDLTKKITIINSLDEIPDIALMLAWNIKATKIYIATGYMYDSGIEMMQPSFTTISKLGGKVELLIGSLQTYKPGVKQKMVNRNTADTINALCEMPGITVRTITDKFYHGKYYYISNGAITYIIMGSSNVTSTAYRNNKELDVVFRFDSNDDPLLCEFESWYNTLKSESTPIDELDLDSFESNLYKDDMGNKHGASYYRNLTSDEEKARYRFLESLHPTRIELNLFVKKRDYKAFSSYIAFVYEEKGVTILECFSYGNASYILSTSDNAEIQRCICRKSKDQVQREDLFITNVPHDELYEASISSVIS